jgi:hypothetical protein
LYGKVGTAPDGHVHSVKLEFSGLCIAHGAELIDETCLGCASLCRSLRSGPRNFMQSYLG